MSKLSILNAEALNYSEEARKILLELGNLDEYLQIPRSDLLKIVGNYEILLVRLAFQIDREIIDTASKLKIIVTATTGLDHIDLDYAQEKNISVLNLRGQLDFLRTIVATAEHSWALLLALSRRIPWAFQSVQAGEWERDNFRGHDLNGRRLGILGLGRIGEKVARYALAFGMQVFAFDPQPISLIPNVKICNSLEELLPQSDVLSIHVPLKPETRNLLGSEELALLPPNALLINTARGQIIDETALVEALLAGRLAGAAVDVLAQERNNNHSSSVIEYARNHGNLIITPHIGGATYEAMAATEIFMAKQLKQSIEDNNALFT
jgi:D-3-phosphoglycerate dehydrogenase / 2-oxoglutarate reductase